jgi:predicted transcriptional regulator
MATFKQDKLRDFTVIRNAIFRDYTLSAKAKGVACQLLSLPPTWDYSVEGLTTLFDDGKASIRSALQELEEHGYLRREQVRADGKFGKSVYVISDLLPSEKPSAEKRTAEKPSAGNPPQLNTKELNTKELNTKRLYLSEFEKLWELYPKKQGRKNAEASYLRARKEGVPYEDVEQGINAYVEYIKATNTQSRYIKHGSTFFNQRAWQDDWTLDRGYSFSSGKTEESFEDMIARL